MRSYHVKRTRWDESLSNACTVGELRAYLDGIPDDYLVLVPGYEGGLEGVCPEVGKPIAVVHWEDEEPYYGPYEDVRDVTDEYLSEVDESYPAVILRGDDSGVRRDAIIEEMGLKSNGLSR